MTRSKYHSIFTQPLLDWYQHYGRKNLPWQHPRNGYRVWISEVMLQQTQVKTAIPYFNRFMERFPTLQILALAHEDDVLALWSGLGYYSRARNLLKTAVIIQTNFQGIFPTDRDQLIKLPGVGASTAAAIISLAFDMPSAILDGNVQRILSRYFLIGGNYKQASVQKKLWQLANECNPRQHCADYTQAIMDLGATCCRLKNPNCNNCPLEATCQARINDKVLEYPQKIQQKLRPTLDEQFLLIYTTNNLIYLEKRPSNGIWGGLWCLPSINIDKCPKNFITTNYPFKIDKIEEVMSFKHTFSHFHLKIKALSIKTKHGSNSLTELPGRWFNAAEITTLGISKPVHLIIQNFLNPSY